MYYIFTATWELHGKSLRWNDEHRQMARSCAQVEGVALSMTKRAETVKTLVQV